MYYFSFPHFPLFKIFATLSPKTKVQTFWRLITQEPFVQITSHLVENIYLHPNLNLTGFRLLFLCCGFWRQENYQACSKSLSIALTLEWLWCSLISQDTKVVYEKLFILNLTQNCISAPLEQTFQMVWNHQVEWLLSYVTMCTCYLYPLFFLPTFLPFVMLTCYILS